MRSNKITSLKRAVIIGLIILITPTILLGQTLPEFIIMTEDWIPYQYEEDGRLKGIAVDLLVEMLKRTGSIQGRKDIKMYPWTRGYQIVQNQKNTILFSTTRTKEREKKFKWVGPIFRNTTYLIGKKSRDLRVNSAEDLVKFNIGTVIEDAGERYMVALGVPLTNLQRNTKAVYNIKKLEIDRIDFVVCGWTAFVNDAKQAGIDPQRYKPVYTVDTADISYAFNVQTPDWIIRIFQSALDSIKDEGKLTEINKRYSHLL